MRFPIRKELIYFSGIFLVFKHRLILKLHPTYRQSRFSYTCQPQRIGGDSLFSFIKNIVLTYYDAQSNTHLHSDDWQRTIYIDTLGVSTTEFSISDEKKEALVNSGLTGTQAYFDWYDSSLDAANK